MTNTKKPQSPAEASANIARPSASTGRDANPLPPCTETPRRGQQFGQAPSPENSLRNSSAGGRLLTLKEAATRLAISLATVRSWVWQRKIEVVRIGRCVRIREQVISELIVESTVPPKSKP